MVAVAAVVAVLNGGEGGGVVDLLPVWWLSSPRIPLLGETSARTPALVLLLP